MSYSQTGDDTVVPPILDLCSPSTNNFVFYTSSSFLITPIFLLYTHCVQFVIYVLASALLNGICRSTCQVLSACLARWSTCSVPFTLIWAGTQRKQVNIPITSILCFMVKISLTMFTLTDELPVLMLISAEQLADAITELFISFSSIHCRANSIAIQFQSIQ